MRYAIKKPLWPYILDVQSPQSQGLVGWWPGDPAGSGTLFDLGGRGNNGTLTNFALTPASGWNAGQDGGPALRFDGTNDYVLLPNTASVQGLTAASISLWYLPLAAPGSANAGIWYESTTSVGFSRFAMFHSSGGDLISAMRDSNAGSSFSITVTTPFTLGKWCHLSLTVDSVSDNLIVYFNGKQAGINSTAKGAFTSGNPADPYAIGAFTRSGVQKYINGFVDSAAIYNRALSAPEVWSLYAPETRWSLRWQPRKASYFFGGGSAPVNNYNGFFNFM